MLHDDFLAAWCDRHLGARPARVLFRSGHLSEVAAAELTDGRRAVIKARPADPRIVACYQRETGRQWTGREVQDAWAAGLWVRLFNAKKDAVGGGPQLDRLASEISDRLALAALGVLRFPRRPR